MGKTELNATVYALRKLRLEAERLQENIDALTEKIKVEMDAREVDTLTGSDWKVTYKLVTQNRLDSAALKRELPDVAARYNKVSSYKRFVLS
ncbi:MAG: hypothetical protein IJK81_13455 [Selenomonadaceae bacterium]|nr:hypothetical protein [Selenomonadaceae bacterium]